MEEGQRTHSRNNSFQNPANHNPNPSEKKEHKIPNQYPMEKIGELDKPKHRNQNNHQEPEDSCARKNDKTTRTPPVTEPEKKSHTAKKRTKTQIKMGRKMGEERRIQMGQGRKGRRGTRQAKRVNQFPL